MFPSKMRRSKRPASHCQVVGNLGARCRPEFIPTTGPPTPTPKSRVTESGNGWACECQPPSAGASLCCLALPQCFPAGSAYPGHTKTQFMSQNTFASMEQQAANRLCSQTSMDIVKYAPGSQLPSRGHAIPGFPPGKVDFLVCTVSPSVESWTPLEIVPPRSSADEHL